MNNEQSVKFVGKLLINFFLSQLFLTVKDTNIKYEKVLPRKIHASLMYFHVEEGQKETSDRRELQLIATNIRGYLEIFFRKKAKNFTPEFPDSGHEYHYLRSGQLEKILLDFLRGNPVNNDIETKFRVDDIDFTRVYDFTKEVLDLEFKSRVI